MASGIGAGLVAPLPKLPPHALYFGEDQARYVVTATPDEADRIMADAARGGVPAILLGRTGGNVLTLPGERPISIAKLRQRFEGWLPAYMAGRDPQ